MYQVSARFLDAIVNPPSIVTRVEVWRGGVRIDTDPDGLRHEGGQVSVDGDKQIRRTLSNLKVSATDEAWELLSPIGTELRVWRGFRYLNGETDLVPVGQFVVDDQVENYGGDWDGQVGAAPDRMVLVQRSRFTQPRTYAPGVLIRDAITEMLSDVLGPVWTTATSAAVFTSPATFERDRLKAVTESCTSIGAEAFIAADGTPVVRDAAVLQEVPVWSVTADERSVLYRAGRRRSRERTYSGVVAAPTQIDGAQPFTPVTVWDEEPTSPTWHLGPFGKVPYFFTSPLLTDPWQAEMAARARLAKVTGMAAQLDLTVECNPALDAGDTIAVTLPPRQWGRPPVTERHLVTNLTVPLDVGGTQAIGTRSTVADSEDSE